jgi:hypothetical protein
LIIGILQKSNCFASNANGSVLFIHRNRRIGATTTVRHVPFVVGVVFSGEVLAAVFQFGVPLNVCTCVLGMLIDTVIGKYFFYFLRFDRSNSSI